MALNTLKCNRLMPLRFKGLRLEQWDERRLDLLLLSAYLINIGK